MRGASSAGLVECAVGEAIDALAAPRVRSGVIELALQWARLDAIPERGPDVGEFIRGALFHAAEQTLGTSAAESIVEQLEPMATMLAEEEVSSVRPAPPCPEPSVDEDNFPEISISAPPPARPQLTSRAGHETSPAPAILTSILVASVDPRSVQEMGLALSGVASIEPVTDALSILEHLERTEMSIIVVDCRRPAVSVETLISLAPEFPEGVHIVLWRERADLESSMAAMGIPVPPDWVCCGTDASAEDVADVVKILME